MRLSGECLEIETKGEFIRHAFPADFVVVDWSCDQVEAYDDSICQTYYEFVNYEIKAYYYGDDNEEVYFTLNPIQTRWCMPDIEKAVELEFLNQ